jgi:thioredoxin reductase
LPYERHIGILGGVDSDIDALVVGGAAAGLSAALVLGRARVQTLVVDAGEPSNRTAPAIGGLLGQDRTSPGELYAAAREQVAALPAVELRAGLVTGIEPAAGNGADPAFRATLGDGGAVTARRVLLAGGMRYDVPDTPGLADLWGTAAFACPYCHGWELRDRRIGILGATGAAHRVALLRSWSDDLVVLADGELALEERDVLRADGVPFTEQRVVGVAPRLVRFAEGDELAVDGLHVLAPMAPRDDPAARLGIATTEHANGTGIAVADKFGATSAPGVFAAGDAAGAGNVAAAIAGGSLAATGLHRTLVVDQA